MTAYADTSVIVAALFNEAATEAARAWLTARRQSDIVISDWTITEVSSAAAIKLRAGSITVAQRNAALAVFHRMAAESFSVLRVTSGDFRVAARFADQHALGVRAGDALHLATALAHGATVCTFDRRLAGAGPSLGVATELLG